MQKANQLVQVALNTQRTSTTSTEPQTFSNAERELTGYFWLRLSNLYGQAKLASQWPDEKTLKLAKMEYAKTIGKFSRGQIHEAFETVKRERQAGNERFDWPNVDAILGLLTREGEITGTWGTAAHKPFDRSRAIEDLTAKQRRREVGARESAKLKEMFS